MESSSITLFIHLSRMCIRANPHSYDIHMAEAGTEGIIMTSRTYECTRCGKQFEWIVRGWSLCGNCAADFMDWRFEKKDEQFRKLYGNSDLRPREVVKRKVEIKSTITVEQWLKGEKEE